MKISDVIKSLQYSLDTYGDMNVFITMGPKDYEDAEMITTDEIYFQDMPDRNELSIQDFPY